MSNVKIPEPAHRSPSGIGYFDSYAKHQMESYAADRVREALEQAAGICDRFADRGMHPAECAGAIRALIPKL